MARGNLPTIKHIYLDIYSNYYVLLNDGSSYRIDPTLISVKPSGSPKFMGVSRYEFDDNYWYINQKVISIGDIKKYGTESESSKGYSSIRILVGQGSFQLRGTKVEGKFCYRPFKDNERLELAWGDGDPIHGGWNGISVSLNRLRNSKIFNQQLRASEGSWLIEFLLSGGSDDEALDKLHQIYYHRMNVLCKHSKI